MLEGLVLHCKDSGLLSRGRWEPCRVLSRGGTSATSFPSSTLSGEQPAAGAGPGAGRPDQPSTPRSQWGVAKEGDATGGVAGSWKYPEGNADRMYCQASEEVGERERSQGEEQGFGLSSRKRVDAINRGGENWPCYFGGKGEPRFEQVRFEAPVRHPSAGLSRHRSDGSAVQRCAGWR